MSCQNLLACLENEQRAVIDFVALLKEESAALIERAAPRRLGELTERKTQAADQLAALGEARDDALNALGLPGGHAGTQAAALQYPELVETWQSLLDASATARQLNERNGVLISTHLRFNRDALNALRAAAGATLYGANGRQPGVGNLSATRRA